ncbi:hypothetical protein WMF45_44930 [Sorangium sp. So ce448]|uniref:hypothetical protein n=1 Tax=Sorangium sp. So ce448 TaxID=3133314 RepID=UPI003F619608
MPSTLGHRFFILPSLRGAQSQGLSLLILTDGNERARRWRGGYAAGAAALVAAAEHVARMPDVSRLIACILSPDNLAQRPDEFFRELHEAFLDLGAAVEGGRALAGVRLGLCGRLGGLRIRGGAASELADAIASTIALTAERTQPGLQLLFGVDYPDSVALDVDVHLVLRTGMEEAGVLRLSGLRVTPGMVNVGVQRLWPDIVPADIDAALEVARRHAYPTLRSGHPLPLALDFVTALENAGIEQPIAVTIPTHAHRSEVARALRERLPNVSRVVRVCSADGRGQRPARSGSSHVVHLLAADQSPVDAADAGYTALLASGQTGPAFLLPAAPRPGYANVHACAPDVDGWIEGIREAIRFAAAHPALRGASRARQLQSGASAPGSPPAQDLAPSTLADRFAQAALDRAASAGLLLSDPCFQQAARNYALTAFFTCFGAGLGDDAASSAAWEPGAHLLARYMLTVAAGDEGVFDLELPDEAAPERLARISSSAAFLQRSLRCEATLGAPPPPVRALVTSIAAQWEEILDRHRDRSHPALLDGWRRGLSDLYEASVKEYLDVVTDNPLVDHLMAGGEAARNAAQQVERLYAARGPGSVAMHLRAALARAAGARHVEAARELRLWLYVIDVAPSVGAGLLFRTAALAVQRGDVPEAGLDALDAVASLLDLRVRLANDLASSHGPTGRDRDPKRSALSVMLGARPPASPDEPAYASCLAACREALALLDRELARAIAALDAVWPGLARMVRRGALVGRLVYERGHYATLSREEMLWIGAEAEQCSRSTDPCSGGLRDPGSAQARLAENLAISSWREPTFSFL